MRQQPNKHTEGHYRKIVNYLRNAARFLWNYGEKSYVPMESESTFRKLLQNQIDGEATISVWCSYDRKSLPKIFIRRFSIITKYNDYFII